MNGIKKNKNYQDDKRKDNDLGNDSKERPKKKFKNEILKSYKLTTCKSNFIGKMRCSWFFLKLPNLGDVMTQMSLGKFV
jgi:hypothetical protein